MNATASDLKAEISSIPTTQIDTKTTRIRVHSDPEKKQADLDWVVDSMSLGKEYGPVLLIHYDDDSYLVAGDGNGYINSTQEYVTLAHHLLEKPLTAQIIPFHEVQYGPKRGFLGNRNGRYTAELEKISVKQRRIPNTPGYRPENIPKIEILEELFQNWMIQAHSELGNRGYVDTGLAQFPESLEYANTEAVALSKTLGVRTRLRGATAIEVGDKQERKIWTTDCNDEAYPNHQYVHMRSEPEWSQEIHLADGKTMVFDIQRTHTSFIPFSKTIPLINILEWNFNGRNNAYPIHSSVVRICDAKRYVY